MYGPCILLSATHQGTLGHLLGVGHSASLRREEQVSFGGFSH